MWFVVYVKPGTEMQAVELLKGTPKSELLEEVFCPMAVCEQKEEGRTIEVLRPMMDGKVFVVAPGKRELRACMRAADGLNAMLDQQPSYEAMVEGEEAFIDLWASSGERVVPISEGEIDKAGYLELYAGMLFDRQDDIEKVSKNRRVAYLVTTVAGKSVLAKAGVRITRNEHLHPWETL